MRERIQWYLGQIQSLEEEVAELKRIAESQFVKEP